MSDNTIEAGGNENPDNGGTPNAGGAPDPADNGFKAIESQDEFDALVRNRLARKEQSVRGEYEGFEQFKADSEAYQQLLESQKTDEQKRQDAFDASKMERETLASENAELKAKLEELSLASLRAEIAAAKGIPAGLASRLRGTTQEEIEADCAELLGQVKPQRTSTKDRPEGDDFSGDPNGGFDPNKLVDKILG